MVSNKRETEASKPVLKVRATLRGRLSPPNDGGNGDVLGRNQSKDMLDEMRAECLAQLSQDCPRYRN